MTAPADSRISDERLAEMEAGLEGVTPGPWGLFAQGNTLCIDNRGGDGRRPTIIDWPGFDQNDMPAKVNKRNARHIARLDPDTIRALITELRERRAQAVTVPDEMAKRWATLVQMLTNYLEPTTYIARFPKRPIKYDTEFSMPHPHHSALMAAEMTRRRDKAFINDVIVLFLLDKPIDEHAAPPPPPPPAQAAGLTVTDEGIERAHDAYYSYPMGTPWDVKMRAAIEVAFALAVQDREE